MSEGRLSEEQIFALERPEPALMTYYALASLLAGPFFFVPLAFFWFRYHTLRYRFDREGIAMRWGILFRREIHLTYSRIQDIHLVSNAVERWLGLARIEIQTASASAKAEMTIEGIAAFAELRDFLYARMRGARDGGVAATATPPQADGATATELTETLRAVAAELRELRRELAARRPAAEPNADD